MSGISSSVGIFSGIDTGALIQQLLAVEAQPKVAIQRRVVELQSVQAAYLDLNSRLSALQTAAQKFRVNRVFDTTRAVSSDPDVISATSQPGAAVGSYSFIVDRLVNTKQMLSRGFANNSTPVGATSFTFEGDEGRIDRDTELSQLNGGQGIHRGSVIITDSTGASATIDLSRVASVNEVLDAINSAGGIGITASAQGDHLVLTDTAGGTAGVRVQSAPGFQTAESLGIAHTPTPNETTVTGTSVYQLAAGTSVTSLNDGNGIRINNTVGTSARDFTITVGTNPAINVNLGAVYDAQSVLQEGPVTDLQGVIDRINSATGGQVTASINASGTGIQLSSTAGAFTVADISGAAADLKITGTSADSGGTQVLAGSRLLAGLNSTLIANLRGGLGLDDGEFSVVTHSGSTYNLQLDVSGSVSDLINQINSGTSGNLTASLDSTGTGLVVTDNTTGASGATLVISGKAAEYLGLDTDPAGVAEQSVSGDRLQHRYFAESTLLSSLNGGRGVGTGRFEIRDSNGATATVSIDADSRSIGDVVDEINTRGLNLHARVNDNGDGLIIEEANPDQGGTQTLRIRDLSGSVAASLHIASEAESADNNIIDGSFERTVQVTAADTLQDIVTKINRVDVGARASIVNDGSSGTPFHLSFTSTHSGREGRFNVTAEGIDLGLTTLADGRDARAFYGSDNAANAVLLSSTTNTLSDVIQGVTIDLQGVSTEPATISISSDTDSIRSAISDFVSAYNDVVSKIDAYSTYDPDTQRRGILLGDSLSQQLRSNLFSTVEGPPDGVEGEYQYLAQVGVTLNSDGELEVNQDRLDAALEHNPQGVKDLFASRVQNQRQRVEVLPGVTVNNTGRDTFSSLGIAEKLGQLANNYLDPIDGFLTQRKNTLDTQIDQQNQRIAEIDDRLAQKQTILEKQFLAMEQALGQLQNQQSALGGLRSIAG